MNWIAEFFCLVAAHLMSPFFKSSFVSITMRMRQNKTKKDSWKHKSYEELVRQVERNVKSSLMYYAQGDLTNAKRQAVDAATYSTFLIKTVESNRSC